MKAHVHYEAAFDAYCRSRGIPFVVVDEAKKASFREVKLKSFDFIVYSTSAEQNWLVDIKGRRWAARGANRKPSWENWITQADLDGLRQWETVFGPGFSGLLVFAYWLDADADPPLELAFTHHDKQYIFAALTAAEYAQHARVRSPKWETINIPTREFAERVRPLADWL